jgi:Flp pilus assembly protein TadB
VWCGPAAKISSFALKIFSAWLVVFGLFFLWVHFLFWGDASQQQHKRLEKQEKSNSSLSLSLSLSLCSFSRRPLERAIFTESEKERQTERSHHHVFDSLF